MFDKEFDAKRDRKLRDLQTQAYCAICSQEARRSAEMGDTRRMMDTQGRPLLAVNRIAELQKKVSLTPGEEIELKMLLERKWQDKTITC